MLPHVNPLLPPSPSVPTGSQPSVRECPYLPSPALWALAKRCLLNTSARGLFSLGRVSVRCQIDLRDGRPLLFRRSRLPAAVRPHPSRSRPINRWPAPWCAAPSNSPRRTQRPWSWWAWALALRRGRERWVSGSYDVVRALCFLRLCFVLVCFVLCGCVFVMCLCVRVCVCVCLCVCVFAFPCLCVFSLCVSVLVFVFALVSLFVCVCACVCESGFLRVPCLRLAFKGNRSRMKTGVKVV